MKPRALRAGASLLVLALSLAGCANYSGLDTQGRRLGAADLQAGKTLGGVALSLRPGPMATGGPALATRNWTA